MTTGALGGARQAYIGGYKNMMRMFGFEDPEWYRAYKGPKQAAKAQRKESKFGAYPEVSRTLGRGLQALLTGDVGKTLPGTQVITPEMERYLVDPLSEEATGIRNVERGRAARYAGRYNLGSEYMMRTGHGRALKEAESIRNARRKGRIWRTLTNRKAALEAMGLSSDIYNPRAQQVMGAESFMASGLASYYSALNAQQNLDSALDSQPGWPANRNQWTGLPDS